MKALVILLSGLLTVLGAVVEAATNERPIQLLSYTPKIGPYFYQPYSSYPGEVIPPVFNGYGFRTTTGVDTWILVGNSSVGPWKRLPWVFRSSVSNAYVWFPWNILSSDKSTFFTLAQTPSPESGMDLAYFDSNSRLCVITNTGRSWGETFTDIAWWVTNRLSISFYDSMGRPVWQSQGAIDENSIEGATRVVYAPVFRVPYWVIPTNPPVQPPTTNTTNVVTVPTNSNPIIVYMVIGTNMYRQIRATNSDGSTLILGSHVGTTGGGGSGPGNNTDPNNPPETPPDPNYNPTGPPAQAQVSGGISAVMDQSFSGYSAFARAMQNGAHPKYSSSGPETNEWSGTFTIPTNGAAALYVRSDDGFTATIDGAVVYDSFNIDTHWAEPANSVVSLGCYAAGSVHTITIRYSNTHHSPGDVDGISVYLVGDYDQARVSGPPMIPFFGADGSDEYTFRWNGHGGTPFWWTSGNLEIVFTNDTFQSIQVRATGPSARYYDTWVEAFVPNTCSSETKIARFYLTVVQPTALQNGGVTRTHQGGRVTSVYTYRILDQFGGPFTARCLATEQTWAVTGNPVGADYIQADSKNVPVTGGVFIDTLSAMRSVGGFIRGQAIWIHRTVGGQGSLVRLNDLYFFVGDLDDIDALPRGTPR